MKIIVTGATGMVGSEVIRQAILDKDVEEITAIVRKPLDITHPKLKTVIHQNFLDYSNLSEIFRNNDACMWCLGISQNLVSKEDYHKITYDYTIAAAEAMLKSNPSITFLFVSGDGADSSEKSMFLFGRVKGKTENALQKFPFKKLYLVRPGGIDPIRQTPGISLYIKLQVMTVKLLRIIAPSLVIHTDKLAKAFLYILKNGSDKIIIEHKDLKRF